MVELREARKAAARTGIGMQYVLKEARVFDIWSKICPVMLSDSVLDDATIVCKGGTSLNKIYFDKVQRFSEDLDLDIFFRDDRSKDEKVEFIREHTISQLTDSYAMQNLHGSTNPYIPKNLRMKWNDPAREISDRIIPRL